MNRHDPEVPEVMLKLLLLIYDLLLDDDEDVRASGASAALHIFHNCNDSHKSVVLVRTASSLSSAAAEKILCRFVVRHFSWMSALLTEVFRRMTGCTFSRGLQVVSLRQQLLEARRESTALFGVEKQNLYIDEVQEAREWRETLLMTVNESDWMRTARDVDDLSAREAKDFQTWVVDGLEYLVGNASQEDDGCLGWTWKPEVFTLGMRAIYAAEVLVVHHIWHSLDPAVSEKVRGILEELGRLGETRGLHEVWVGEIKRILAEKKDMD